MNMYTLLNIDPSEYGDFSLWNDFSRIGDALAFGGMMLGIGLLTVFSVLLLLWSSVALFHRVCGKIQKTDAPAVVSDKADEVVSAPVYTPDDGEIVAVIAAAIAMAESENNGMKFRVVSFKRK